MMIPHGPLLVVEDVPHILELLQLTLRFKGYPVIAVSNGEEALAAIEKELPAMVITDILMPKLDGFALAHKLRSNPKTSRIPIVFLSATYVTPEDKRFAMSLGAVRFLEKPVDTEEFLLTVAEVLTADLSNLPEPLGDREFYSGYRERLENKLRHKLSQISRTERLLRTLPETHRSAYQALLEEAIRHRDEIQKELQELERILSQNQE
ncbi:MAG: response regulator [Anaerolineales bacterium]|nr:response regulator [Anaerolineales bacterium]MDW8162585.1 response regulator [Anaerolineales bacterium]